MLEYISKFLEKIEIYEKLLLQISNKESSVKKLPTKWSRKEILGHLIDSANVNHNRFVSAVCKNDLIFETYNQDDWVKLHQYNKQNWNELIFLWKLINLQIAEVVQNIADEKRLENTTKHNLDRICYNLVERNSETNLDYLIIDYIAHLEHHLKQILNTTKENNA